MKKEINYVAKKEEWKEAQEKELNKVTKKSFKNTERI